MTPKVCYPTMLFFGAQALFAGGAFDGDGFFEVVDFLFAEVAPVPGLEAF